MLRSAKLRTTLLNLTCALYHGPSAFLALSGQGISSNPTCGCMEQCFRLSSTGGSCRPGLPLHTQHAQTQLRPWRLHPSCSMRARSPGASGGSVVAGVWVPASSNVNVKASLVARPSSLLAVLDVDVGALVRMRRQFARSSGGMAQKCKINLTSGIVQAHGQEVARHPEGRDMQEALMAHAYGPELARQLGGRNLQSLWGSRSRPTSMPMISTPRVRRSKTGPRASSSHRFPWHASG